MGGFQSGHKQGQHNAEHRDQAHQLTALDLSGSNQHGRLRRSDAVTDSAYSNFHRLANVRLLHWWSVSFQVITKVFGLEGRIGKGLEKPALQTLAVGNCMTRAAVLAWKCIERRFANHSFRAGPKGS